LALHPIRIEAPIPNRSLVGLEVPNKAKATVSLRENLESKAYRNRENNLMVALGKDVTASNRLDNLGKMPHLLVAGATNTGKSVCLNSIIVSLMYQNNPDDLRFILVDPKRVELSLYNGIPYLLTPVITGVKETINALRWCLNEMDRRFDLLKDSGVKNIASYNQKYKIRMPYIVFIIDELADLMVANRHDIEAGVIRLSQMARAVGIHLILATQRPSVDIITGVIKANMPSRIAFTVASGVDSKTILDNYGAEKLLGRGDMLFKNQEMSKPTRIQGAYISEQEIKKIVRYVKDKSGNFDYLKEITEKHKVAGMGGVGLNTGGDDMDEYFEEAKELVINTNKASTTYLQRKFGIGYARAAKILDALEEAGVVGASNGAKPREIMVTREQYEAIADIGVSGASLHKREESKPPPEFLESDEEDEENEDEPDEPSYAEASAGKEEEKSDDDDDENNQEDEENDDEDIFNEDDNDKKDGPASAKATAGESKNKKTFVNLDDDAKLFSR
jgi:S-DNA-T family DNA segregation ATPase FtsK/SpoIIIE